ncbi:MAG TPA: hypothetical protein VOA87_04420, partial [Thermoanaerobaculia bacterium]|nr:hypothetical protein [Thermoanaerobaculia bacterium]
MDVASQKEAPARLDQRLLLATVLVEIGEIGAAEAQVVRRLADEPQDRNGLSLLAKIKHIRGELSAAIACWAQISTLALEGEGARMRLASMLQLAQDPERGAGEFLALGQNQLWRKPAALLELESAFRLFVSLRPDDARAACARLAAKSHEQDRDVYKLAVLAEAWIAELAGDPEGAAQVLEQLGNERGFAGDTDRALALVRVYEILGRAEDLEKAIHVCEYLVESLQSFEAVTTLGRLAALCRAAGRRDEAADYDRQFLAAFEARMHRPTTADVVEAASRQYLPLPRLGAARFVPAGLPAGASPRQRGLHLALSGPSADRIGKARPLLERSGKVLDRKYLADLALLEGRPETAVRLFLSTLAEDPDDPRVIGWLLDQLDAVEAPDAPEGAWQAEGQLIREHFARPESFQLAVSALEARVREAPRRAGAWRHLAILYRLHGDAAGERRSAERAAALAAAEKRRESAVGRVLSA